MKKYWYDVYDRGLDTVAVWTCCAPTFPVGELNLAAHAADVNLVSALLPPLAGAEDVLDTARDSRDIVAATLRDLCVRGCRLIASTVPAGDPMADKVQAVYAVRSQTFRALQDKTVKLITAWQAMNEHRAALNPAQPALLVGTTTVSEVQSLLGNYAQLLDNVSKKEAPVKTKKGLFHLAANRVDQNNKRWYKAWLGQFAAGSVERAALKISGLF